MQEIKFAVIGAGGFARFAVAEFVNVPGSKLVGVFDESLENAHELQRVHHAIRVYSSLEELLGDNSVDLVYIGTPPYLHYPQSKAALLAGKHVICEKPAAIELKHAVELKELAKDKDLLFVVNLMQRYNPLYASVTALIREKILGEFLHGFFENYASDEFLPEEHWFWDLDKSGGIFIEHGVHFFDMFGGWLGDGKVISSQKLNRRHHPEVWDKFQAIVQYDDALVNFYHGFDQPKAMDRQEMRLQFEKGEITLYEWVPTQLKMTALVTKHDLDHLNDIFPSATIDFLENHHEVKTAIGKFKAIPFQYKIRLDTREAVPKMTLYADLVFNMFKDQADWIRDRKHERVITDENAVKSLELAVEAEKRCEIISIQ